MIINIIIFVKHQETHSIYWPNKKGVKKIKNTNLNL